MSHSRLLRAVAAALPPSLPAAAPLPTAAAGAGGSSTRWTSALALGFLAASAPVLCDDSAPPPPPPPPSGDDKPSVTTGAAVVRFLRPALESVRKHFGLTMHDFPRVLVYTTDATTGAVSVRLTSAWKPGEGGNVEDLNITQLSAIVSATCKATVVSLTDTHATLHTKNCTLEVGPTHSGAPWMWQIRWNAPSGFSTAELESLVALFAAGAKCLVDEGKTHVVAPRLLPEGSSGGDTTKSGDSKDSKRAAAMATLQKHGVSVYEVKDGEDGEANPVDWDCLAGMTAIREEVEDCILMPQRHPDVYAKVQALTRARTEDRGAFFLFEGPPGIGKTLTARIVATKSALPLVVLSFDNVGSMYHSESERKLKEVLTAVTDLDGCVLFIDEAESFFPARGAYRGGSHNTPEKLLSQLLMFLDGFKSDASQATTVIFATNRQSDLDAALLSRCTSVITFKMPDKDARAQIWQRYAKHLLPRDLEELSACSDGFSGRDIKKVAEMVEKRHTAALLRPAVAGDDFESALAVTPPAAELYLRIVEERRDGFANGRSSHTKL